MYVCLLLNALAPTNFTEKNKPALKPVFVFALLNVEMFVGQLLFLRADYLNSFNGYLNVSGFLFIQVSNGVEFCTKRITILLCETDV